MKASLIDIYTQVWFLISYDKEDDLFNIGEEWDTIILEDGTIYKRIYDHWIKFENVFELVKHESAKRIFQIDNIKQIFLDCYEEFNLDTNQLKKAFNFLTLTEV